MRSSSSLARIGLALYVLLVVYGSLYPLAGWRDHGASAFAYILAPWPPRFIAFDVAMNVVGYIPFGFLGVAALAPRVRGFTAFAIVTLSSFALSVALEALQTYLPSRFASNVDVLCNVAGAAAGALFGLHVASRFLAKPASGRLRAAFLSGPAVDFGLVLLALWLLTQLNPDTLVFASGDLREFLGAADPQGQPPPFFIGVEAAITVANVGALGMLVSALAAEGAPVRVAMLVLFAAGLVVKTAAFAIVVHAPDAFAWLTPGTQMGLPLGLALALAAAALPRPLRLAAAAMLLMAATVLVNIAPANPYVAAAAWISHQGYFLNFNGLTHLVSAIWPFAALGYLMVLAARRPRE